MSTFPQFEKVFEEGNTEPFLRQVARTRFQLNEIAAKGATAAEKQRATSAHDAYTKALALVQEIDVERRRMAATSAEPVR